MKIVYDTREIQELLGYRPVYLMVDSILEKEPGSPLIAVKNISANEAFFQGHFPGKPILPGIMQLEAMFQLAIIQYRRSYPAFQGIPTIQKLQQVKFRSPVFPGDQLHVVSEMLVADENSFSIRAATYIGEKKTSETNMVCCLQNEKNIGLSSKEHFSFSPDPKNVIYEAEEIQKLIPHRYPFFFVDRILERRLAENGQCTITGLKSITSNEPFLLCSSAGGRPFVSPLFQIEAIAQVGCVYMLSQSQHQGKYVVFLSIDDACFYHLTAPGDQWIMQADCTLIREKYGKGKGRIFVGNTLVGEASIKFAVMNQNDG